MAAGHVLIQSTSLKVGLLIQQLLSVDDLPLSLIHLRLRVALRCGDGDLPQTGESR